MDLATLVGILIGVGMISWALASGGGISTFIDLPSIAITLGGTLAATLIAFPLKSVLGVMKVSSKVFFSKETDLVGEIGNLVALAEQARREGLLALEDRLDQLEDPFLRKGLQLVIDGMDPELVRNVLETDLAFAQERHRNGQAMLETMGAMAPAFGMIGTLIGLVQMLKDLDNPDAVGPGLAVALLTTFYGALLANLFFLPMAGKLKVNSAREMLHRELIVEGIMAIQAGDNPRIVEEKLRAFLPPKERSHEAKGGAEAGAEDESGAGTLMPGLRGADR